MTTLGFPRLAPQRLLLIGAKPATNGGLHLGHVGGPYLRMDMLRRHLLRRGHEARVVFGTDPYDSFVALKAKVEGRRPVEVAARFHAQIVEDLRAFHIHADAIIDPTEEPWRERHRAAYREVLERLTAAGKVDAVEEPLWYAAAIDQYGLGGWISGHCPSCRGDVSGFFCEYCGAYMEPSELVGCTPRADDGIAWTTRKATSLYHTVGDADRLLRQLAETRTPAEFIGVVERQLRESPQRFRLASPRSAEDWGLVWTAPDGAPYQMSLVGLLFAYCLVCGDAYRELTGDAVNPFHARSPVRTINFFGLDNTISHMVFIQELALADPAWKPFDQFVVNYFRTLEGEKFSTSRGHAIWASDIVTNTPLPADAIRLYLAARDATHARSDFGLDDCAAFVNEHWVEGIQRWVEVRAAAAAELPLEAPAPALIDALRDQLERQHAAFDVAAFEPRAVVDTILAWITRPAQGVRQACWELAGFALLAYPVLPVLGCRLWTWLGHEGEPTLEAFGATRRPVGQLALDRLAPITAATLAPCLPPTLAR